MTSRLAAALALAVALSAPAVAASAQAGQVVAGARVAAVADRLAKALVTDPDASIAPAYTVTDVTVAEGAVTIATAGNPVVTPTYLSVPVAVLVDGKTARTLVAGYRVTHYVRTTVAAHDITPGTLLAEGDVVVARVPSNGRAASDLGAIVGRRMRVAAVKGAVIYPEQTAPEELVKAGQPAVLIVRDGVVALSADVVARTGGALGEMVTIYNPQTRKALAGVVTGRGRVELTLPEISDAH